MAEAIFSKFAPIGFSTKSVGTTVADKEGKSAEGEKLMDREGAKVVLEVLHELGIDARTAIRNQITNLDFEEADLVIVMAEKDTLPDYLMNAPFSKVRYWDLGDPKGKDLDETRKIRDQIHQYTDDLLKELRDLKKF